MIAKAYIDGSFNAKLGMYGAGAALFLGEEEEPIQLSQSGDNPAFVGTRNVAGEVMAAVLVIEACRQVPELTELTLYYDYKGIECWATGSWRANNTLSQAYREFTRNLPFKLSFKKVKAHTGDIYNELADRLAKAACRL